MLFSSGLFVIDNLPSFVIYVMKLIPQLTHAINADNNGYPCVFLHLHTVWSWRCIYGVLVNTQSYINTGPDVSFLILQKLQ